MDGEDFLEEPYNFGECWEITTTVPAYCNAWKNRSREIKVLIRKEGNYTHVHFPKALFSSREGINTDQCKIIVDLYYPLADKDSMFHISKCRSRNFVGSMQIYDHYGIKDKIVAAEIDYDRNWGTLTFIPVLNKKYSSDEITLSKNVYDIGILETSFTIVEESEDLVVSADEDETMDERDPVVSVFPDDINNEEYDEDGIPEGWIKQTITNNVIFRKTNIQLGEITLIYAKNKERTKGILIIPPIMGLINIDEEINARYLQIKCNVDFFTWLPAGIIADDGEMVVYEPHSYMSSAHYKIKKAKIYFASNLIIFPDDDSDWYKYNYALKYPLIKQREIGLSKRWKIEFDIPSTKPTYVRILEPESTVNDISVFPSFTGDYNRTLPVKAHMHVWDGYVSGEADCTYHIDSDEVFNGTIKLKNLLAPHKKTASLQKDALQINIEDLLDFYGGNIHTNGGNGKVKAYNPTTKAVEEMDAKITIENNIIYVTPDNVSIQHFYSENINITEDVGIIELTIFVNISPEFFAA